MLLGQTKNEITVLDNGKRPLLGVQVLNVTKGNHFHTNEKGTFQTTKISIGDTLKAYLIGYEIVEVVIEKLPTQIVMQEKYASIEEVVVAPEVNALNLFTDIDIQTNPVNSSQDILRQVPGLIIGQHAGGGKAEQIFLRGFDIDHGTDISINVDGMPVNVVSHAHGQGYADLHFLIPETIEKIDFGKGTYYAEQGNFNTAGYVNFQTKRILDYNSIKLEGGQFDTKRILGAFNVAKTNRHNAYVALEYLDTDGAFESPQNFHRINLFGKYTTDITPNDKLGVSLSHFTSKWDASGQVPQRSVDNGSISRFGAIDDTEGGSTSRTNVRLHYDKFLNENAVIKTNFYYSQYDFELYSNFTFFLEDSINGDQIKQHETRTMIGLNSEYFQSFSLGEKVEGHLKFGVSLRNDQSQDNELSHTLNRSETLSYLSLGDINETNLGAYASATFDYGKWTLNLGVRADYFNFEYNDALLTNYETQTASKINISPKLNLLYNYSSTLQGYIKAGKGFHSNDTRVVVAQNGRQILPSAYGVDAGLIWKPMKRLVLNAAYWYLFLEQEFVYVGDAGIVEPSGQTQRQGVELSVRYQPLKWLFWNFDANYTHARATEEEEGENYIPLAPDLTITSGISIRHAQTGLYGGLNMRYIKDRPANEDNSIVAKGYTVFDLNVGWEYKRFNFGVRVENLFNTEWNETQFATTSRLAQESTTVEEIHFTPGTPFFIRGVVEYRF
jgi:outer membrane receptor protein involved in Fe transport